ncbi:hypothetical protein B0T17DRAFT_621529 [Bombardia bombarda]|uniref:Uncharacterized protein n=1 Tax=Bombardia bombarda TaxID=252184 RepID=A0AA39T0P1_9PEZI|nr:hypothetical protein B0T17DRAFT_621529 [Bombardia bombarda]
MKCHWRIVINALYLAQQTGAAPRESQAAAPCHDLLNALEYLGEMQAYLQGMLIGGVPFSDTKTQSLVQQVYTAMDEAVTKIKTLRKSDICAAEVAASIGQQSFRKRQTSPSPCHVLDGVLVQLNEVEVLAEQLATEQVSSYGLDVPRIKQRVQEAEDKVAQAEAVFKQSGDCV